MIRQLSYLSAAHLGFGELDDVARMAAHAAAMNGANQVTGLLAHGGGLFFQTLEGPRDCVQAVFERIRRDPRHFGLRIVQDEMIDSRDFAAWPLAVRQLAPSESRLLLNRGLSDDDIIAIAVSGLVCGLHALPQDAMRLAA